MAIFAIFGVDTDNLMEARDWVEAATKLKLVEGYSDHKGGEYYSADSVTGREIVRLVSNSDVQDDEPLYDEARDWSIAVTVSDESETSLVMASLVAEPAKFERVSIKTFSP